MIPRKLLPLASAGPADVVTSMSIVCGILAMFYAVDGLMWLPLFLISIAVAFDSADGFVARKWPSSHNMGSHIDSMADLISFVFAPAVLVYAAFYDVSRGSWYEDPINAMAMYGSAFILLGGVLRLLDFVLNQEGSVHFKGIPTTYFALALVAILAAYEAHGNLPAFIVLFWPLVGSILMISDRPYPKIKGRVVGLVIIPWLILTLGLLATLVVGEPLHYLLYVLLSGIILVYAFWDWTQVCIEE